MKELLLLLVIGAVVSVGKASDAGPCCDPGANITSRGICDNGRRANLNCTQGRWLLKEIVLDGNKVSTKDTPSFVFVENPKLYCLGYAPNNFSNPLVDIVPAAMVCFEGTAAPSKSLALTGILTLISAVFLLLTLAVYMFVPQMRDLQGCCCISLCISMALGYLSLGVLQLNPDFINEICSITGFMVYFWMIATFFWMNVISINTYRSVQDPGYLKKTERQQYFRYSCYAWGCSFIFLFATLCANYAEGNHWKPGIGSNSCWFQGATETWIFFYGPVAILIACNVGCFFASSWILWRQNRKYEVDKLNVLKHKFLLSLKLFLVMGVTWIFEIASFAHGESLLIWKIMDIFNCLQGVVIFILLVVLRRRAIQGLAKENFLPFITKPLAELLSPHDEDEDDTQRVIPEDTTEVRLN